MKTRAIVNTAPDILAMREIEVRRPEAGEALIRTLACGICATDLAMIRGWERTGFPAIPGHEWCGRVQEVGEAVDPGLEGRLVTGDNILPDGGEIGFERPGGYAAHFITRADNLIALAEGVDASEATLVEPLAVCLRGIGKVQDVLPADALILGDGPIGLLCLMLLRHSGSRYVAIAGGREARLKLAKSLGAAEAVDYHRAANLASAVKEATGRASWPLVAESSGSAAAIASSVELAGKGGRILVLGDYGSARADFPWNTLLHKELTIAGSNTGSGAWQAAALLAGALPLSALVTHRFRAEDFAAAVETTRDRASGAVKAVIEWE